MAADNKANEHGKNAEVRIRESMQATLAKKFFTILCHLIKNLKLKMQLNIETE